MTEYCWSKITSDTCAGAMHMKSRFGVKRERLVVKRVRTVEGEADTVRGRGGRDGHCECVQHMQPGSVGVLTMQPGSVCDLTMSALRGSPLPHPLPPLSPSPHHVGAQGLALVYELPHVLLQVGAQLRALADPPDVPHATGAAVPEV